MNFPKVLILGQTFNKKDGGGVTMSNLFTGWPKDKLAVASNANLHSDLDTLVCNTYYQLGYNNKLHPFPLNILLPKIKCGIITISKSSNGQTEILKEVKTIKSGKYKTIYNSLEKILHFFGLYNVFYKLKITPEFVEWLKEYNPDIIYTQLATLELIRFTHETHDLIKKPVVIHMMDDWPSTISEKGLLKNFWYKKIDHEFRLLLNKTTLLLSISDSMAQEYKIRYNKSSVTFHNPIEIEFWKSHQRKKYELNTIPNILYAGRIGKGIDRALETMANAIDLINKELKTPLQFILQTKDKPAWVENYKCMKYKTPVEYNELPKLFSEADFLYLPYDFSVGSIKFIQYSMPTKAPEYMVSGTPIIMFAPEETALVKAAQNGKWAKVVTDNDIDKLSGAVKQLLINEKERKQIALNAIEIAETKFNSITVRNNFKEIIASIIK
jgi:glycosyltransferase involved in cell wall biosynthesis